MKKITSILLVMVMLLSLAVPAFAGERDLLIEEVTKSGDLTSSHYTITDIETYVLKAETYMNQSKNVGNLPLFIKALKELNKTTNEVEFYQFKDGHFLNNETDRIWFNLKTEIYYVEGNTVGVYTSIEALNKAIQEKIDEAYGLYSIGTTIEPYKDGAVEIILRNETIDFDSFIPPNKQMSNTMALIPVAMFTVTSQPTTIAEGTLMQGEQFAEANTDKALIDFSGNGMKDFLYTDFVGKLSKWEQLSGVFADMNNFSFEFGWVDTTNDTNGIETYTFRNEPTLVEIPDPEVPESIIREIPEVEIPNVNPTPETETTNDTRPVEKAEDPTVEIPEDKIPDNEPTPEPKDDPFNPVVPVVVVALAGMSIFTFTFFKKEKVQVYSRSEDVSEDEILLGNYKFKNKDDFRIDLTDTLDLLADKQVLVVKISENLKGRMYGNEIIIVVDEAEKTVKLNAVDLGDKTIYEAVISKKDLLG